MNGFHSKAFGLTVARLAAGVTLGLALTGVPAPATTADTGVTAITATSKVQILSRVAVGKPAVVMLAGDTGGQALMVRWGDASVSVPLAGRATHIYRKPGTYRVVVTADGGGILADQQVVVVRKAAGTQSKWKTFRVIAPVRDAHTGASARVDSQALLTDAGYVRVASGNGNQWQPSNGKATFKPCQTVYWYWDRSNEPTDRNRFYELAQPAFDILSRVTGLTFIEAQSKTDSQIWFSWGDWDFGREYGEWSLGVTLLYEYSHRADIIWSPFHSEISNRQNGFFQVKNPNGYTVHSNGVLLIHEIMHALGLAHVDNESSIMYPYSETVSTFSAGDIAGLTTLYPRDHCPAG